MAPEVMLEGHVSKAADVYAFGVTMWEVFTSGHAYKGEPAMCGLTARPIAPYLWTPAILQS